MNSTTEAMTKKEWIHRLVEAIEDENDLDTVKRLLQSYAARSLNRKYKEEHRHEEDQ